jgi:hypothetical protein
MPRTESGKFTMFVGAWVIGVKVSSDMEKEWLWLVGDCNLADLGTRATATHESLCAGAEYQEGMAWIKEPMNMWPCKKSFGPAPEEEMRNEKRHVGGLVQHRLEST